MKQMNLMEQELGLDLLIRTNHGIKLTEVGKQIYKDCKFIIDYSNQAIKNAKKIQNQNTHFVTIGTSLICPCKPLLDLWYKINDQYPEFKIKIVPFEENHTIILNTLNSNGVNLDFIVSPCDSKQWLENFNFLKLGDYRFCVAVPISHPLAKKEEISYKDLYSYDEEELWSIIKISKDKEIQELVKKFETIKTIPDLEYPEIKKRVLNPLVKGKRMLQLEKESV